MKGRDIVNLTAEYVKATMAKEGTGHDWWHVYRVWRTAMSIAKHEKGVDLTVVQLGALLHDISDWKFSGRENSGEEAAERWLARAGADKRTIAQVGSIVRNVSFKGADKENRMKGKEGLIVQDADRLDALGAIGIARAFGYGGHIGRTLYDPKIKPRRYRSAAEYRISYKSTTINHFYEKLLLLKGRMSTKTGREMAENRDRFVRSYLNQFYKEWKGKV